VLDFFLNADIIERSSEMFGRDSEIISRENNFYQAPQVLASEV